MAIKLMEQQKLTELMYLQLKHQSFLMDFLLRSNRFSTSVFENVKNYGDKSLIEYTKKFDNIELTTIEVEAKSISNSDMFHTLQER